MVCIFICLLGVSSIQFNYYFVWVDAELYYCVALIFQVILDIEVRGRINKIVSK